MKKFNFVFVVALSILCGFTQISEAKVKKTRKARTEKVATNNPKQSSQEMGTERMNNSRKTTNDKEYVDLGLPSGTLWATMNVGANHPEDYGDYFAWGEIATKDVYNWSTYKWCMGNDEEFTKYCTFSRCGYKGFVDNKMELEPEDDAATANWGSEWCMPSKEQQDELRNYCSTEWTTRNGVNGCLFTSNINGASLFLPAAGLSGGGGLGYAGSDGYYWSRTLYSAYRPDLVHNLHFHLGNVDWNRLTRGCGRSVRAVRVSQN